jgi:FolB domain-containing protein
VDTVFIQGLQLEAVIGVHAWERRAPQPLRLDLELGIDLGAAAASDDLCDTLDYAAVCERLRAHARASTCRLVETLAEQCCALLIEEFGARHVRLRLTKPAAVREAEGVGVMLEREAAPRPA